MQGASEDRHPTAPASNGAPGSAGPEIAVVLPLVDIRRGLDRCLRTWTHEQTVDRGRFQVVVAMSDERPRLEPVLRARLAAHDIQARFPGADEQELWQRGASAATAPWLLISEAHCRADPRCLEAVLDAIERAPGLDAAALGCDHDAIGIYTELLPRFFEEHFTQEASREWTELRLLGFVIRAELYAATGGIEPRYGLAAQVVLSARLHEQRRQLCALPAARITHIHDERLADHHAHSANHARGQCNARADFDPAFCERYFGYQPIWGNQLRYEPKIARRVGAAALRTAVAQRRAGLLRELWRVMSAAIGGLAPPRRRARTALTAWAFAAERLPLPPATRYRAFLRAYEHTVRLAHLDWLAEHREALPAVPARDGRWSVEELTPRELSGVHGLERHAGRVFRWTEPVVVLRLAPAGGASAITLDTGELRGAPDACVLAVFAGRRRVKHSQLAGEAGRLRIALSPAQADAARDGGLIIVCDPLLPRRTGSADGRELGLPVFTIELASGLRTGPHDEASAAARDVRRPAVWRPGWRAGFITRRRRIPRR